MVLGHVNRTTWGTKLLLMAVWASLVDLSLTEGTALLFGPNGCFTPPSAPHMPPPPTPPTPIESIRDITGAEKKLSKTK